MKNDKEIMHTDNPMPKFSLNSIMPKDIQEMLFAVSTIKAKKTRQDQIRKVEEQARRLYPNLFRKEIQWQQ